jgi:hypothetical protein
MGKQEYLGIVAILESARATIDVVRNTLALDASKASSQLLAVSADLSKAIAAYQEKADAQRP